MTLRSVASESPELLTVREAAELLRCSRRTVYRLLRSHPDLACRVAGLRIRRTRLLLLISGGPVKANPPRSSLVRDHRGKLRAL